MIIPINVTEDDNPPLPELRVFNVKKDIPVVNNSVSIVYGFEHAFSLSYSAVPIDGYYDIFKQLEQGINQSTILKYGGAGATVLSAGCNVQPVLPGTEKIEIVPGLTVTVTVYLPDDEILEEKPVIKNEASSSLNIKDDTLATSQSKLSTEILKNIDFDYLNNVIGEVSKNYEVVDGEKLECSIYVETNVSVDSKTKNLVFDISPVVKVVSNKTGTIVDVGKTKFDITEPVAMELPVGDYFNGEMPETVYVTHVKEDGTKYVYTAAYNAETKTVTFENPHGFSTFSISSTAPEGYYVNGTYYATAAEALAVLSNNGTLTVTTNADITVDKAITFTLVTAEGKTVKILTTDEFEVTNQGNVYTVKTKTPSTPGTGNEGGSGSNPTPGEGNNSGSNTEVTNPGTGNNGGSGTEITPPSNGTDNSSSTANEKKEPVVDTGDHTEVMLYGGIGVVALIGALAVILFRRKHA